MEDKAIPSRSQKRATTEHIPPGSPREEEELVIPVDATMTAPPSNPFHLPSETQKRKMDLSGRYRVREGYRVAHGLRKGDAEHAVGEHHVALSGEIVDLTHEEAVSVIKLTKDQRDPKTGRPHGPAIETEVAYNARVNAEAEHKRFMEEVNGINSLEALNS